jgi:hypothetical protein
MDAELHFIEADLDGHEWYIELVADFVEDVQRFVYDQVELEDLS